jgi:tetratricopeptide (TPR) repeat protein
MALAQIELALNQPLRALAALAKAEKSSPYRGGETVAPEFYAQIAVARAEAYSLLGDIRQAVEYQEEAVRLTPSAAARWNKLADLLEMSGEAGRAEEARKRAQEVGGSTAQRSLH